MKITKALTLATLAAYGVSNTEGQKISFDTIAELEAAGYDTKFDQDVHNPNWFRSDFTLANLGYKDVLVPKENMIGSRNEKVYTKVPVYVSTEDYSIENMRTNNPDAFKSYNGNLGRTALRNSGLVIESDETLRISEIEILTKDGKPLLLPKNAYGQNCFSGQNGPEGLYDAGYKSYGEQSDEITVVDCNGNEETNRIWIRPPSPQNSWNLINNDNTRCKHFNAGKSGKAPFWQCRLPKKNSARQFITEPSMIAKDFIVRIHRVDGHDKSAYEHATVSFMGLELGTLSELKNKDFVEFNLLPDTKQHTVGESLNTYSDLLHDIQSGFVDETNYNYVKSNKMFEMVNNFYESGIYLFQPYETNTNMDDVCILAIKDKGKDDKVDGKSIWDIEDEKQYLMGRDYNEIEGNKYINTDVMKKAVEQLKSKLSESMHKDMLRNCGVVDLIGFKMGGAKAVSLLTEMSGMSFKVRNVLTLGSPKTLNDKKYEADDGITRVTLCSHHWRAKDSAYDLFKVDKYDEAEKTVCTKDRNGFVKTRDRNILVPSNLDSCDVVQNNAFGTYFDVKVEGDDFTNRPGHVAQATCGEMIFIKTDNSVVSANNDDESRREFRDLFWKFDEDKFEYKSFKDYTEGVDYKQLYPNNEKKVLKIYNKNSKGYVIISEVEVFDKNGNQIYGSNAKASCTPGWAPWSKAQNIYDGNTDSEWGDHLFHSCWGYNWVQAEFPADVDVGRITIRGLRGKRRIAKDYDNTWVSFGGVELGSLNAMYDRRTWVHFTNIPN